MDPAMKMFITTETTRVTIIIVFVLYVEDSIPLFKLLSASCLPMEKPPGFLLIVPLIFDLNILESMKFMYKTSLTSCFEMKLGLSNTSLKVITEEL